MVEVRVDDDFARFGAKSYAINKINSVEVRQREPYGWGSVIICGGIAAFSAFVLLGSLAQGDVTGIGWSLVFTAAFAWLTWWSWQRTKIREYLLFLMTSSSETQAYITRDAEEVTTLRESIESAMLRHSRAGTDR